MTVQDYFDQSANDATVTREHLQSIIASQNAETARLRAQLDGLTAALENSLRLLNEALREKRYGGLR